MSSAKSRHFLRHLSASLLSLSLAAGLTGALSVTTTAYAQDLSQGALRAAVRTNDGKPAAGAKLSLRNLEQGFVRTATADQSGIVRLANLMTGDYEVKIEAAGASSLTQTISIGLGGTTDYAFSLPKGANNTVSELVVMGRRSVSPFDATTTGLSVDVASTVETIPLGMNVNAVALLSPGVVPGTGGFSSLISMNGGSGGENSYYVNGLNITKFRNLTGASSVPFRFYKTVETKTGGFAAEFGRATGGVINSVTKSGGRQWRFEVSGYTSPNALSEVAPNTYSQLNQYDRSSASALTFEASGPVIKDHIYVYGLYEIRKHDSFDASASGSADTDKIRDPFFGTKIDVIFNPRHRLELTGWSDISTTSTYRNNFDTAKGTLGSSRGHINGQSGGYNGIARYTASWTDWLTTSIAYGVNNQRDASRADNYRYGYIFDISGPTSRDVAPYATAGNTLNKDSRKVLRFDTDLFFTAFGEHRLKFGLDQENLRSYQEDSYSGQGYSYCRPGGFTTGEACVNGGMSYRYQTADKTGQATAVRVRYQRNTGNFDAVQRAFYIQDSWMVTDRLTLNLGLRNETFENKGADHKAFVNMDNQWAPRLGAIFDPKGDKSIKLFAFYGRYYLPMPTNVNLTQASNKLFVSDFWTLDKTQASDTNHNGIHDEGPNPDYSPYLGKLTSTTDFATGYVMETANKIATNLKPMYTDEFILGYEQRFENEWSAGVKLTHRRMGRIIEDIDADMGVLTYCKREGITGCDKVWNGLHQIVVTNPGESATFLLDAADLAKTSLGKDAKSRMITLSKEDLKLPHARRDYTALELSFASPPRKKWSLSGSYVWASLKGNYEGSLNSDFNQDSPGLNKDFDEAGFLDGAYGPLPNMREHTLKLFGSYKVLENLTIGGDILIQSPQQYGCMGNHPTDAFAARQEPATWYCFGKLTGRGSQFESDWRKRLDLSATYYLPTKSITAIRSAYVKIDVFNVFNSQTVLGRNQYGELSNSGKPGAGPANPNYKMPTRYETPRYARLSFNVKF